MMKCGIIFTLLITVFIAGCSSSSQTSNYQLSDGYYIATLPGKQKNNVYINNRNDTLAVHRIQLVTRLIDTLNDLTLVFPQQMIVAGSLPVRFTQASFDIDFLTIPFKYRPVQQQFPRQFNTNLNGAIYVGYRNDVYQLRYAKTPFKDYTRQTHHYGFSLGLFTGLGGTAVNPSVTNNQLTVEYDGVVWSKGVAGIIGINNFTLGIALGYDNLLDANRKNWLYQRKPWLGLAFGLNIN